MRALLVDLVRRGLGNVYGDVFIARSAFPHERSAEKFIHHIIVVCSNICLTFLPRDQILRKLLTAQYTQRIANNRKCFFLLNATSSVGWEKFQFNLCTFCFYFAYFSSISPPFWCFTPNYFLFISECSELPLRNLNAAAFRSIPISFLEIPFFIYIKQSTNNIHDEMKFLETRNVTNFTSWLLVLSA